MSLPLVPLRHATGPMILLVTLVASVLPIRSIDAIERPRDADRIEAERLAEEAIRAGSEGKNDERRALLEQALTLDPECLVARQALGHVRRGRQWLDPGSEVARIASDPKEEKYRERRDIAQDTAEGQRELAQWCMAQGLDDRGRCHWERVLQWAPDDLEARRQLGFEAIGGRWVSLQELRESAERLEHDQADYESTKAMMEGLSERLASESPQVRALAIEDLQALQDPRCIVALELMVISTGPEVASAILDRISQFSTLRATEALARLAITANSPEIRKAAALALRDREPIDFAPPMLNELRMPVTVSTQVVPIQSRTLLFREVLCGEDRQTRGIAVRDTGLRRQARPLGDAQETLGRMLTDITMENRDTRSDVEAVNQQIRFVNQRVIEALRRATGEDLEQDPRTWWEWWNQINGIEPSTKPVSRTYATRQYEYEDTPQFPPGTPTGPGTTATARFQGECLAAGTLVTTDRGPTPIEEVTIGDRVLAQHPLDGRIEFRAVRRCTIRRPSPIIAIDLGDETLRSSEGHPFWVVGQGWTLARHLEPGMMLHTQEGGVRIEAIESVAAETTFNLVVDEFATYFVGKHRVLGHDFTERGPTEVSVPGLAR